MSFKIALGGVAAWAHPDSDLRIDKYEHEGRARYTGELLLDPDDATLKNRLEAIEGQEVEIFTTLQGRYSLAMLGKITEKLRSRGLDVTITIEPMSEEERKGARAPRINFISPANRISDYSFDNLDWQQFEMLCGALISAEGFVGLHPFGRRGEPDRGVDWVFESTWGDTWVAQVKLIRGHGPGASSLRRVALDLEHGAKLVGASHALLIVSKRLPEKLKDEVKRSVNVEVWDGTTLDSLLAKHAAVRKAYWDTIHSIGELELLSQGYVQSTPDTAAQSLLRRLSEIPAGREGWRLYEDVCIDILNYCFIPPLRPPRIQSSTDDGLDRRDAIYPIGQQGGPFWESLKYQHSSRMVVAEFKNYIEPIGQREVESLHQYLLPKARRSFGIICSRSSPSESAIKARRRAWMLAENLIVFLSDGDLTELIQMRSDSRDPTEVLDAQIDEFFIKLAP